MWMNPQKMMMMIGVGNMQRAHHADFLENGGACPTGMDRRKAKNLIEKPTLIFN